MSITKGASSHQSNTQHYAVYTCAIGSWRLDAPLLSHSCNEVYISGGYIYIKVCGRKLKCRAANINMSMYVQELMSGEAAKERVTLVRPNPNYLRISVLETKKKASPNGEGSRDLQIYDVFVANRFHCHPFAWPFHCG